MRAQVGPAASWGSALIVLLGWAILLPATRMLTRWWLGSDPGSEPPQTLAIGLIAFRWSGIVLWLLLLLIVRRLIPVPDPDLRSPSVSILHAVTAGIVALLILQGISAVSTGIGMAMTDQANVPEPPAGLVIVLVLQDSVWIIPEFVAGVLMIPLIEELIFRGILWQAFSRIMAPWLIIATTTVLFLAAHGDWTSGSMPWTATTAIFIAAGGFILGLLRHFTGGLLAPLVFHSLWNATGYLIAMA